MPLTRVFLYQIAWKKKKLGTLAIRRLAMEWFPWVIAALGILGILVSIVVDRNV